MSWKGFQKGLARAPQNLRQKVNKNAGSKDLVYLDAEDRFQSLEAETKKLQTEARRYWEAINSMLNHQTRYAEFLETVYNPISGRLSDPNATEIEEANLQGIAACQQYRAQVQELRMMLQPEMDMIEAHIIRPANEMLTITQSIKKMFTKRDHKRIDLDRHEVALRKAQDKNDQSVKHEEKVYKVENEYEMALEEYNYFNNLLKTELSQLFTLQRNFMRPLFESFYYMQINIFYTLSSQMEQMKIPYFDLKGDIVSEFERKRGDVLARTESLGITQFKRSTPKSKFRKPGSGGTGSATPEDDGWGFSDDEERPPRYIDEVEEPQRTASLSRNISSSCNTSLCRSGSLNEPQKPPRPPRPAAEMCEALYDYEAQTAGDLSFVVGDRIEIIDRSGEGWWKGSLNGKKGAFPANHVELQ